LLRCSSCRRQRVPGQQRWLRPSHALPEHRWLSCLRQLPSRLHWKWLRWLPRSVVRSPVLPLSHTDFRADINECLINHGGCDRLVSCTNTNGSRICGHCPSGYSGRGDRVCTGEQTIAPWSVSVPAVTQNGCCCSDVNECEHNRCDRRTVCANLPGTFSCSPCPLGFTGTGVTGCRG
jgi:hypothetical protein